jgi:exosortase F-associated protein
MTSIVKRSLYAALGILGLALSYLFQYTDFLQMISGNQFTPESHFIVNRIVRMLINDISMIGVIYAIFLSKDVLKLALLIQMIDLLVLLPLYLMVKLPSEGVSELSSPFLSQLHRLIVNPTLMILLIPAVIYQRSKDTYEKKN